MHSLVQIIYASEACPDFHEHDIPDLLKQIRPANAKSQVTGMLLYVGRSFLQVLEGPAEAVDAIFARIIVDPRHAQVIRLTRETASDRQFPDWTMDFLCIHPVDVAALIGRSDFCSKGSCITLQVPEAKKLIAALRRPSWQQSLLKNTPLPASKATRG
jgi:hypothetical protein